MRIVLISPFLAVGGSERLTVRWARALSRRGHDVTVLYGVNDVRPNVLVADLDAEGIPHRCIGSRELGARTVAGWSRSLAPVIREIGPDVIHAQSIPAVVASYLADRSVPVVATVHGLANRRLERVAALALSHMAAAVTAVSEQTAAGLHSGPTSLTVEVLQTGIDIAELDEKAAGAAPSVGGPPSFCCVARQEPVKGVDILVEAFPEVLAHLPEATLTIVGEGSVLDTNRDRAAALGIAEQVEFTGTVPSGVPYLASAHIAVLPSRREGLPLVALEALGLGRPVVATDVGGTKTVVHDGETGWLIAPKNPRELARALVEAGGNLDEARRRGENGRALLLREYPPSGPVEQLEAIFHDVIDSALAPPPLKPLPYYRLMNGRQQLRIASGMLRRDHRSEWTGVRIFGYHRVSDDVDPLAVTPQQLADHARALAKADVEVVSLERALQLLDSPVDGRYVTITFDDGFRDFADIAVPILSEFGFTPTVFIPTDVIDGMATYSWYDVPPPAMSWNQMSELLSHGTADVQPHSRAHLSLPRLSDARALTEIAGSMEILSARLGVSATTFCYPAGLYSPRDAELVLRSGMRAGVTTRPGINDHDTPKAELRRTMIGWRDSRRTFEHKLAGRLDRPSAITELAQSLRSR